MTNADDRIFGTEVITSIGQQTYDKYALLDHLTSVFINQIGSPAAAAVVAAPILKPCKKQLWEYLLVCERIQRIVTVSFEHVKGENVPVEKTSKWEGLLPTRPANSFKAYTGQVDELVEKNVYRLPSSKWICLSLTQFN